MLPCLTRELAVTNLVWNDRTYRGRRWPTSEHLRGEEKEYIWLWIVSF